MWVLLSLLAYLCSAPLSSAYLVTVDAHSEECFFERVEKGTKMGLMFEISEGGFLDIDVKITGPDGKIVHQGDSETSGKYTFAADATGVYTYCFINQMLSVSPKLVMFNMEIGEKPTDGKEENLDHNQLEQMIKDLTTALTSVKHEQEYMTVRDRTHHNINEATNARVVQWSFFEAAVFVTMTLGQVYYLKRYFEVKRII